MAKFLPKQVVWLNQISSNNNSHPPQPADTSKPRRMYIVVGSAPNSKYITCCPIQGAGNRTFMTEVELAQSDYPKFLSKDCKVIAHEIFTVEESYFDQRPAGVVSELDMNKIKAALTVYLKFI